MDVEDFLAAMQFGHQHESCCQLHSNTAQLREALRLKKAGMDLRFTPASAMAVVVGSRWGSPAMGLSCNVEHVIRTLCNIHNNNVIYTTIM